jgi:DGQHR domain-containing protein
MTAGELLDVVDILRRDFTPEGRERVQREYSKEQGEKIAKYALEHDATFPTSVILSAYKSCVRLDENNGLLHLGRPVKVSGEESDDEIAWEPLSTEAPFKIGEIVDGQHRLLGIKHAIEELGAKDLKSFEMPVVFMLDLNPNDKAYVFSTINGTQRRVSSSLIVDLFGLREGRSPRKTCHELAETFYEWPKGPFENGLKMLGKKTKDGEMLSQGSFSKYILRLITRRPDDDELRIRRNEKLLPDDKCPLREFYLADKDPTVARILHEYFSAVRNSFPEEWDEAPEDYLLRKTVGFSALTKAFVDTWDRSKVTDPESAAKYFDSIANKYRENLGTRKLTSQYFASSEKGARELADALTGADKKIETDT